MMEITWSAGYMLMGMLCFYGGHSELGNLSLLNMTDFEDIYCLSANAYHEARGVDKKEQVAVTQVVMNRVLHGFYPNDICDVITQPDQFSWYSDHIPNDIKDLVAWEKTVQAVLFAYKPYRDFGGIHDGSSTWSQLRRLGISQDIIVRDLVHGATHYYAHNRRGKPKWTNGMTVTTILEGHTYLRWGEYENPRGINVPDN